MPSTIARLLFSSWMVLVALINRSCSKLSCITLGVAVRLPQLVFGPAWPCVWSGLAATLLPGGRTCHARVGFLVPLPREDVPWSVTTATGLAFRSPLASETLQSSALINWPGLLPSAQ